MELLDELLLTSSGSDSDDLPEYEQEAEEEEEIEASTGEAVEEEETEISAWQRDPEYSFSDWTIRVSRIKDEGTFEDSGGGKGHEEERHPSRGRSNHGENDVSTSTGRTRRQSPNDVVLVDGKNGTDETVYHVHRVFLASGPRRSEYFQTLFSLSSNTQESLSNTTKLVLPESACWAFPRFLNFVYDTTKEAEATTKGTEDGNRNKWKTEGRIPNCLEDDGEVFARTRLEDEFDVYASLITSDDDGASGDGTSYSMDDDDEDETNHTNDPDNVYSSLLAGGTTANRGKRHVGLNEAALREEVGLAFLADYLRVPKLERALRLRIRAILKPCTVHVICREALLYKMEWIVDECMAVAATRPRDLLHGMEDSEARGSAPPALQTLELLSHVQQVQLLKLALSKSLG